MGNRISKTKKNKQHKETQSITVTNRDKAILSLKLQRDKFFNYCNAIENKRDQLYNEAKVLIQQHNKERALDKLSKRKKLELQHSKIIKYLNNIEEIISHVEFSLVEKQVLHMLSIGTTVLANINKEISVDFNPAMVIEEASAEIKYSNEVASILCQELEFDDINDVEEELKQLFETSKGTVDKNLKTNNKKTLLNVEDRPDKSIQDIAIENINVPSKSIQKSQYSLN